MFIFVAAAIVLPLALVVMGLRNERAFSREWEVLLTPRGSETYLQMRLQMQRYLILYDLSHRRAMELRAIGSIGEALTMIEAGRRLVEGLVEDRVRQLAAMSALSRMVAALTPVPPLRPRAFRLRRLATAAGLAFVAHHLLITARERLRLRLEVLRYGFGLGPRLMARLMDQARKPSTAAAAWDGLDAVHHDYGVLCEEMLEAFRLILLSTAAEQKSAAVPIVSWR